MIEFCGKEYSLSHKSDRESLTKHLYDEYREVLATVLFRYSSSEHIEDLLQETFIQIWKSLENYKGKSSLKTYVTSIAINVAKSHLRKTYAKSWLSFFGDDLPEWKSEGKQDQSDKKTDLHNALTKMKAKHREVVMLFSMEEYSIEEISEILEVSQGTVKSRLHYAREQLKKHLKEFSSA